MGINDDKRLSITATANATALFRMNPELSFSASDIRAINAGTLVPIPNPGFALPGRGPKDFGCITYLQFLDGDDDLSQVRFDSGERLDKANATNLNDFRETFKCAANHGYGVTACHFTATKKIRMVNLIPCRCGCDKRD